MDAVMVKKIEEEKKNAHLTLLKSLSETGK